MHPNEQLINRFYSAFQARDYQTMQSCYAENAVFNDPVFKDLSSYRVKKMWEMFCVSGNATIVYQGVKADDIHGRANWIATYTFSKTGRKVINNIWAEFTFENGKIKRHHDTFNFYKWSSQALGFTGKLLGWTSFLSKKVQQNALKSLDAYISKNL
jgi:ketosteroid isomerase-like protein